MDSDAPSSPIALPSSLPPSSAPDATPFANGSPRHRPIADALALDNDEAEEDNEEVPTRAGRRKRARQDGDIPMVKDAVGESVAASFETFLKT